LRPALGLPTPENEWLPEGAFIEEWQELVARDYGSWLFGRAASWFPEATLSVPAWLAKRGREHRVYLGSVERKLFREQLMIRAPGTTLVFPTPNGCQWNCSGFRERVCEGCESCRQ
jgi:hypothetical protein